MVKLMRKVESKILPIVAPREPEKHAVLDRLKKAGKGLEDLLVKS